MLGKVDIGGSSFFELKNVSMLPEQGSKTVAFTVTVNNGGTSDLLFIDYWVRLKTERPAIKSRFVCCRRTKTKTGSHENPLEKHQLLCQRE